MTKLITNTLVDLDNITIDYEYLDYQETDLVIEHVKDHLLYVKRTPSQSQWSDAWDDVAKCDAPKYFTPRFKIQNQGIYRYNQRYIKSSFENLEGKFHDNLLKKIQDKWLSDIDCVVEFGCGTGHNLQKIRDKNPNIKVYGSDWAGSSQKILEKQNIPSWNFDMTIPDNSVELPSEILQYNSICFLTIGSMEQIGDKWHNFLKFMLDFKPKKSIHIEPIIEFYDPSNKVDALAIEYHKKRNYLSGFFSHVRTMKELKFYERTFFGNTYNEGFSVLELEYE